MDSWKTAWPLLRDAWKRFGDDEAGRFGASLAYYTVFSLAPLLVITIGIAGLVFGVTAAEERVLLELGGFLGPDGIETVRGIVHATDSKEKGGALAVFGFLMLLVGAGGVFKELKDAFNRIFDVEGKRSGLAGFVLKNVFSVGMVLATGFLLLISLLLSALLSAASAYFSDALPLAPVFWEALNFILSFLMATSLFLLMFRYIPDRRVAWCKLLSGAVVTAVLFTLGKTLLGLYLGRSGVASSYGAAGAVILILLWVYYTSQVIFFGAELTAAQAGIGRASTAEAVSKAKEEKEEEPSLARGILVFGALWLVKLFLRRITKKWR